MSCFPTMIYYKKKKKSPKNKYAWFFVFVFLVAKALGKKHKTEVKLMNWNPGRRKGLAEYKWGGGGGGEPASWEDQDREEELCDLEGKGGNWILILAGQHAEPRDKNNIWMAPGCLRRGILLEVELQAEPRGCMTQRNWCRPMKSSITCSQSQQRGLRDKSFLAMQAGSVSIGSWGWVLDSEEFLHSGYGKGSLTWDMPDNSGFTTITSAHTQL